jgi:hypothetical protein
MTCRPYMIVQKIFPHTHTHTHTHTTLIQIQSTAVYLALECARTSKLMNKHCLLSKLQEIIYRNTINATEVTSPVNNSLLRSLYLFITILRRTHTRDPKDYTEYLRSRQQRRIGAVQVRIHPFLA